MNEDKAKALALLATPKEALVHQAKAAGHQFDQARMTSAALAMMLSGFDRIMLAKFPGTCCHCGGTIGKLKAIRHYKADHKAAHIDCAWRVDVLGDTQPALGDTQPALGDTQPAPLAIDSQKPQDPQPFTLTPEPAPVVPTIDRQEPSTMNQTPAIPAEAGAAISTAIAAAVGAALTSFKPGIDADQVTAIVRAELAQQQVRPVIQITTPKGETIKLPDEHRHPMFAKVLALVNAGLNVALVGPAGTGKSHMAEQVARALGRRYGILNGSAGASESHLTGWLLPTGENGRFEYRASDFVECYEQGNSLFVFDEYDAFDPNMILCTNSATANGFFNVPHRVGSPLVRRAADVGLMAIMNTFGTGATALYGARNPLDAATLDRWYIVSIDYDTGLEAAITGRAAKRSAFWQPACTDAEAVAVDVACGADWLDHIRAGVVTHKLRRVVSTRAMQKLALARAAGCSLAEIKADLLAGWTDDERAKVGA